METYFAALVEGLQNPVSACASPEKWNLSCMLSRAFGALFTTESWGCKKYGEARRETWKGVQVRPRLDLRLYVDGGTGSGSLNHAAREGTMTKLTQGFLVVLGS